MFPSIQKIIVTSILLFLFPLSAVVNADTLFSLDTTDKTTTSIAQNELSSKALAAPPGEQKCWVDAYVNIFHLQDKNEQDSKGVDHHTTTDFCENATPVHKKALAFEVARCTLQDLGRSIINTIIGWNIEDPQECTAIALYDETVEAGNQQGIFPNLELCLKYMTETGVHVYTQFFSHIIHTCNRLTHHLAITFQQQTATQLAKMSRQAMSHFNDIIHRQQEAFYEREEAMRKQHEDFYAAMHEQHNELLEGHSGRMDEFKSWTSGVMRDWTERDQEHKKQHQFWIENQTAFLLTQVAEIERLRAESVASATRFFQPFMSMGFLISLATYGYTLLTFLLHFIGTFKITWLLTRPRRCQGFRGCLFAVVVMEGLAELCVHFVMENGLLSDAQQQAFVISLRKASWCLEALIFVVGLLFSCCCGAGDCSLGNDYDDDDEEEEDIEDVDQQGLGVVGPTPAEDIQRQQIEQAFHRLLDEALAKRAESQVVLPANTSTYPVAPRRDHNIHIPSPPHAPFFHGRHVLQPATLEIPPPPPMIYHRRSSSEPQVNRASIQYYGSSQVAERPSTAIDKRDDDKIGMVVSPLSNGGLFSPVRGSSSMGRARLAEALEERATGNVLGTTANMATTFRGKMNDVQQGLMVAPPAPHQPLLSVPPPGMTQDNNHRSAFHDDNHYNKKRSNEEMRATNSDPKSNDDDNIEDDEEEDAESECSSQPKRRRIMTTEDDEAEMKMGALSNTTSKGKMINTTGGYMCMEEEAKDEESGDDDFVSCNENDDDDDDDDNVSTKMDDDEMDNNDGDRHLSMDDDGDMDAEEEGHLDDV